MAGIATRFHQLPIAHQRLFEAPRNHAVSAFHAYRETTRSMGWRENAYHPRSRKPSERCAHAPSATRSMWAQLRPSCDGQSVLDSAPDTISSRDESEHRRSGFLWWNWQQRVPAQHFVQPTRAGPWRADQEEGGRDCRASGAAQAIARTAPTGPWLCIVSISWIAYGHPCDFRPESGSSMKE